MSASDIEYVRRKEGTAPFRTYVTLGWLCKNGASIWIDFSRTDADPRECCTLTAWSVRPSRILVILKERLISTYAQLTGNVNFLEAMTSLPTRLMSRIFYVLDIDFSGYRITSVR